MHVSFGAWQKYWAVAKAVLQKTQSGLGEHEPPGPQSESTAHWLPARQTFAKLWEGDARHEQGTRAGQSESLKHSSYVHTVPVHPAGAQSGKHRPFAPAVQSESRVQVDAPPLGSGPLPGPRCRGHDELAGLCCSGTRPSSPPPSRARATVSGGAPASDGEMASEDPLLASGVPLSTLSPPSPARVVESTSGAPSLWALPSTATPPSGPALPPWAIEPPQPARTAISARHRGITTTSVPAPDAHSLPTTGSRGRRPAISCTLLSEAGAARPRVKR
jgi:hypothetical protein